MMELLGIIAGGLVAISLTANWVLWRHLIRYADLFGAVYQLTGRIVMNDDAGDDALSSETLELEQTRLLDVLSDPDGKEADTLLNEDHRSLSSVVEHSLVEGKVVGSTPAASATPPVKSYRENWPPMFGPYF